MALTQTIEKKQCDQHGEYDSNVVSIGGKQLVQPCPTCSKIAEDERKRIESARQAEAQRQLHQEHIASLFRNACIPLRFRDRTFENYSAEGVPARARAAKVAKSYAEKFDERLKAGGGLVMCGKPGTGKTHLAAAIANYIIPMGHSAVFRSVLQAIRSVKDTYNKSSEVSETEAIEALILPKLLILDEVGVQFGSDAERMILFEIINGRYEKMRPTILISNLNEQDLTAYLGERIMDRMCEGGGVVLAFDWDSYRRSR